MEPCANVVTPGLTPPAHDVRPICGHDVVSGLDDRGSPDVDDAIRRLATRQCGVVSRRQLLALGVHHKLIAHRVRTRRLIPLYQGVYAVGHEATSDLGRITAALLAVPKAVAATPRPRTSTPHPHPAAVRRGHRPRPRRPLTPGPRHPRDDARAASRETARVRVTDVRRTLADLNDERITREAVVKGLIRRDETHVAPTRSNVERRMLKLIHDAGLPTPLVNHKLGPYMLDFVWLDQRVVLEMDTYATHGDRTTFEKDRARDADTNAWGFRVMRATDLQANVRTIARLAATLSR